MADIRINALATTATTPASDDYLALDGTAQGTRKILATNIANNVTDVILGASGPSVKSSLSARAPRQGLVFDGTAGATVSVAGPGTSDFTQAAWVRTTGGTQPITSGTPTAIASLYVSSTGKAQFRNDGVAILLTGNATINDGKSHLVVATRTGGTLTIYVDGISDASVADSTNFSTAITRIGLDYSGSVRFTGSLVGPLIYNRALSASEVVALYEAGAPAGADYATPAATNTALNSSTVVLAGAGGSLSGESATGFTATYSNGSYAYVNTQPTFTATASTSFAVSFTASGVSGRVDARLRGSTTVGGSITVANGTNTAVLTGASGTVYLEFYNALLTASGVTVSSLVVKPIGLLLAPDAAQAGGGLTWYDTSGNSANITLPASGVSWNVPFAGYVTAPTTTNLTLAGGSSGASLALGQGTTGTFTFTLPSISAGNTTWISAGATGIGIDFKRATATATLGSTLASLNGYNGATRSTIFEFNGDGATDSGRFDWWVKPTAGSLTQAMVLKSNGNLLIGTTVDSSALLQVGTNTTTAAGGMKFGTDTSLYRTGAGELAINGSTTPLFRFYNGATQYGYVLLGSSSGEISSITGSLLFKSSNTTALTLDSSQNATFAGTGQQSFNGIIQVAKTAAGANSNLLDLYNKGTTNNTSSGIAFSANNASSAQRTSAEIRGIMTVTTAGSEESELWFSTRGAGVASGTAALKIANTGNATFAGTVTVSKANAGLDTSLTVNNTDSAANSTSSLILTSVAGSWTIQNNRSGGHLYFKDPATSATQLQINNSTGLATFAGAIAIGNTVQTAAGVASTHKVTISIGGTTYYLLATT